MLAKHSIHLLNTDEHFPCSEHSDVLRAMESLGRRGVPVGCRGGGCGVCKVKIHEGSYTRKKMSRAFVSAEEEAGGIALACRVQPQSAMRLEAIGKLARFVARSMSVSPSLGKPTTADTKPTTKSTECAS